MTTEFLPPPPLPPWLSKQLPFNRRVFKDGDHSIHFVDEGEGAPILLLHGNPTWSFLWRKVIGILASENVRVIAPDLVGLGLSSKPRDLRIHTLNFHADRVSTLVEALELEDITIAGQDWGGPIIAVMAARNSNRIRGAVFSNTALRVPTKPPRVTQFHRFSHRPMISDLAFRVFGYPLGTLHLVQGDRSSIDADGYFWFVGRDDDVINTGGHLVGPFEIESALVEHDAVAEAAAVGKPDPVNMEVVKAFVTLNHGFEPSGELELSIMNFIRKKLSPLAMPQEIEFQDKLPRTRSGKILRRYLKAIEWGEDVGDLSTLEDD